MHVALIHPSPRTEFDKHWARFPVLGLGYLASSLRAEGHDVRLYDGKLDGLSTDEICAAIIRDPPDLVGITCMTVEFPQAAEIARQIKINRDIPIIVGGAHINAVREQALRECQHFDYACIGEGEYLINEVALTLKGLSRLEDIPGLIFRRGEAIITNAKRGYPTNYDDLKFPAWDLFRPVDQMPILTHRGCPFQCTFCGHNSGFKPRYRTPENVLKEIEHIINNYHPKIIRFEDETFGLHMKRTKAILHGILEAGFHKKVGFSAQTRVDRIDEEFIALLKATNFETLELGVESGNPRILKEIRKGITLEQVDYAVRLAKSNGLLVWCKFILGHPNETKSTLGDTVKYISRLNPDRLSVSIMTPFPGTPIHDMAMRGEGGYRILDGGWEDFDKYSTGILELKNISLGELKFYQIWCYLRLYLLNFRFSDMLRISWNYRSMAWEMLSGAVTRWVRERISTLRLTIRETKS